MDVNLFIQEKKKRVRVPKAFCLVQEEGDNYGGLCFCFFF